MISVSIYLSILAPEFIYRLETEYKLGKAYRYFSCDFVREIYYHVVSERSCQCILKCKILPSQQVSIKPYDVWAIIEKDQIDKPGGKIYSAYCTCTAGLQGGCNHVVAMLFKIESAVATGATNPSKTTTNHTWESSNVISLTSTKIDCKCSISLEDPYVLVDTVLNFLFIEVDVNFGPTHSCRTYLLMNE